MVRQQRFERYVNVIQRHERRVLASAMDINVHGGGVVVMGDRQILIKPTGIRHVASINRGASIRRLSVVSRIGGISGGAAVSRLAGVSRGAGISRSRDAAINRFAGISRSRLISLQQIAEVNTVGPRGRAPASNRKAVDLVVAIFLGIMKIIPYYIYVNDQVILF